MKFRIELLRQFKVNDTVVLPSCIDFIFEEHWSNHFTIRLFFPIIDNRDTHGCLDEDVKTLSLSFDTGITTRKTSYSFGVTFKVLGFGISFLRQDGY